MSESQGAPPEERPHEETIGAIVWNVEPPPDPIKLATGLYLRALKHEDLILIERHDHAFGRPVWRRTENAVPQAMIVLDWPALLRSGEVDLMQGVSTDRFIDWLHAAVTAFRLVGDAWIAPVEIVDSGATGPSIYATFSTLLPRTLRSTPPTEPFTVTQSMIDDFGPLYARLMSYPFSQEKSVDIAFGRFHETYERWSDEDKLIDAWIGLESLFIASDQQRDLSESVATGISFYLGRSISERDQLRAEVKNSYRSRSLIAHGHRAKSSQQYRQTIDDLPRAAVVTTGWLRQTLRKLVLELSDPTQLHGASS